MADSKRVAQALFLHERLVYNAVDATDARRLEIEVTRRKAIGFAGDDHAQTSA